MPKKDKNKIVVKKVPLEYYPERFHASFPPMPILYLELLENKQKVKKDLRLKEYVPPVDRVELSNQVPTTEQAESQTDKDIDKDFELKEYEEDNTVMKKVGKKNIKILDLTDPDKEKKEEFTEEKIKEYTKEQEYNDQENKFREEKRDERRESKEERQEYRDERREQREKDSNRSSREDDDLDYDKIKKRLEQRYDRIKEEYRNSRNSRNTNNTFNTSSKSSYNKDKDNRNDRDESRRYSREESTKQKDDRYYDEDKEDKYERQEEKSSNKLSNEEDVQKKIMDLFTTDDKPAKQVSFQTPSQSSYQSNQNTQNVQSTQSNQNTQNTQNTQSANNPFVPPTLSQINNGVVRDNKGVRDMTRGLSKQEDEEDAERRLYLDKFSILKRKYKDFKMPDFSPYSDISIMKRTYDSAVKQLHLDSTVETYKKYLIGGFTLTQFLFSKFLKIDMTGFAEQQILSMNQYEQVLVEIGEKSYFKPPSKMAPEFKLLMLIGFNAVIFLISKMILKASGDNILSSINKVAEKKEPQITSAPKNHMKGPNMDDLADLQNMINGNKSKKD